MNWAACPATALFWKVTLEGRRGDAVATLEAADALLALSEKHSITTYVDFGRIYANWARGRLGDPEASAVDLRRDLDELVAKGNKASAAHFNGLLAELEVAAERPDRALTLIGHGLAIAEETAEHLFDPYLHHLRGEVLLRRDLPTRLAPRIAFKAAIAIAKRQGARSYELLASLSLAKLYLDRPPRGRPRRPRAGARRLLADAGNAGDRRGAGAARGAVRKPLSERRPSAAARTAARRRSRARAGRAAGGRR